MKMFKSILTSVAIAVMTVSLTVAMAKSVKIAVARERKNDIGNLPIAVYRMEYEGKVYLVNSHGGIIEHRAAR